jgi:hypothetical protein
LRREAVIYVYLYKKLAAESSKPNKLNRYLETLSCECVGKALEFFYRKLNGFDQRE